MDLSEKQKLKQLDRVAVRKLWPYFTKDDIALYDNGYIGFHPDVSDEIVDEIVSNVELLDEFMHQYYQTVKLDFHHQSERGCYILSSIFCLANPSWHLIQGVFDFEDKNQVYYHSWLKKGHIIFDCAMRVVTIDSLYEEFFLSKYCYQKEQLIALLEQTGMFTYYEEDLKNGCVNPIGQMFYYRTEKAKQTGSEIVQKLETFLQDKTKHIS